MHSRRSVRDFDTTFQLETEALNQLLNLARYAPTAFNLQNERFLIVKDPEKRKKIREAACDQKQVTESSALIVVCADLQFWQKPDAVFQNAPKDFQDLYIKKLIPDSYQDKPQMQRDEGFRSASMAAYGVMLAATASGLATCPMTGFDFEKVGKIINLPEKYAIIMMIAIGKPASSPQLRLTQLPLQEMVKIDHF
ncbi:nitroreductase family protein [Acetobacteraceae bacterium]|nr:nitroreductase family protein [Acetobacteraceae bacterium]